MINLRAFRCSIILLELESNCSTRCGKVHALSLNQGHMFCAMAHQKARNSSYGEICLTFTDFLITPGNSWSKTMPLKVPRVQHSMVNVGGQILAIGGITINNGTTDYATTVELWSETDGGVDLPTPLNFGVAVIAAVTLM